MKDNKGFTLVELLAVIGILGVIITMAVTAVIPTINKSKMNSAKDSAMSYIDAASELQFVYFNGSRINGDFTINSSGNLTNGTDTYDVKVSGTKPNSGYLNYAQNKVTEGCLSISEFKVTIKNNKIKKVVKGSCNIGGEVIEDDDTNEEYIAEDYIMKKDILSGNSINLSEDLILSVQFTKSFSIMPGEYSDTWNLSNNNSEKIVAYAIKSSEKGRENHNLYDLIIYSKNDIILPQDSSSLFEGYTNTKSITGLNNINTSNVTNMGNMFRNCTQLTSLDVSNFDTSKVTNMSYMFMGLSKLTSLDVSNFDTSNVTNMSYMFQYMSALTSLDLSSFDTSKVTNSIYMLSYMSNLTSIDLANSNCVFSDAFEFGYLFFETHNIKNIYVSSNFPARLRNGIPSSVTTTVR